MHNIFISKITEVKSCMSLLEYHDVTLVANNATAYTPILWQNKKLILIAIVLFYNSIVTEKGTDLTQSYDKHQQKCQQKKTTQTTPQNVRLNYFSFRK